MIGRVTSTWDVKKYVKRFIECNSFYILGTRDIKSDDGKTKTAETGNSR